MLSATVPAAASQVAPAEAARIAAVLQAALSRATVGAYTLRLDTYAPAAAPGTTPSRFWPSSPDRPARARTFGDNN